MNTLLERQNILSLPAGYTARGGSIDDYKIACELLNLHSMHMNGSVDLNDPELLRLDWQNEGFTPETDLRMIFDEHGTLVAFIECWMTQQPPVHPWIFGCVHPEHWGRGIGSHINSWAEDHAHIALEKCAPELRVAPRTGVEAHNETGVALMEGLGWKHIRSFYRMVTDLDSPPTEPSLPDGIVIRPFDAGIISNIVKAIQTSEVGLTPNSDGRLIRVNVPPLSTERRRQLAARVKELAEEARVAIRNVRRDGNKHADQLQKDKGCTEDERDTLKEQVQELTKTYESKVNSLAEGKETEIMED